MDYILRVFENGQFVNDYHSCVEFKRDHPEHPKHYQYQTSVNRIFSFFDCTNTLLRSDLKST